jgi:hypothetical protein
MKEATQRKGSAWWVWLVAASFLLDFGLMLRNDWAGPGLGLHAVYQDRGMVVQEIYAPSEKVPLQQGDRILRVENHLIASDADWLVVLYNLQAGKPLTFEIQRDNQNRQVSVTPWIRRYGGYFSLGLLIFIRIAQMMALAVACVVAFVRPRNPAALLTALFFSGLITLNVPDTLIGFSATVRDFPPLVVALLSITGTAGALTALFLFLFCITFPRPLIQSRWILMLLCIPPVAWSIPSVVFGTRLVYDPDRAFGMLSEPVFIAMNMAAVAYFSAAPVALALNYRRLTDVNERRRLRVLVFGTGAGLLALISVTLAIVVPSLRNGMFGRLVLAPSPAAIFVVAGFLAFPASFAYAVLRHRLFDVRVIVRQGLQYAMARGVLLSALPLVVAAFLLDIFIHRQESLATIVAARGFAYAAFASVTAILYSKRQQWLDRIDRRFFRDRHDTLRVLQRVVLNMKQAKNFEAAAREVVNQVYAALHPEFVSVLHGAPHETELRFIACVPADHRPPEIPMSGKLMAFLRLIEQPVQLSASTPITEALRGEEMKLMEEHRLDLVVPIAVGPDRAESLLLLGRKRSEEPYSREDEKLLAAIAAGLALLSAGTAGDADWQSFKECTECGTCFTTSQTVCSEDSTALVQVYLPRILAKRYRLERRVGCGGMGTVYSGVDEALERPVAIKVIRPDLIQQGGLRARFHREARAAAGLMHRNVITIYDFGIERQHPFIVMELLLGRTLRSELECLKTLSVERTIGILEGVCAATEEAHRRQFLHRDLKPENIFLADTSTGEVVKVLDFGLAKALGISNMSSTTTAVGGVAGTPWYMAPEQLFGEQSGPQSDIWALGVIAHEMLTGTHPFVAKTAAALQQALLEGTLTAFRVQLPNLPREAQSVFERVFQRDPARRTASAGSFLSELRLALRNQNKMNTRSG